MRASFALAFAFAFFSGCKSSVTGTPPSEKEYDITAVFSLSDTDNGGETRFRAGDNFDLSFVMVNRTADTLYYDVTGPPPVVFTITHKCSVVASSVDGYGFIQIVKRKTFLPGDTLQARWRAPITPAQKPRVRLVQGVYNAGVTFPTFPGRTVSPIEPIPFAVDN